MTDENAVTVRNETGMMTFKSIKDRVNLVHEILNNIMQANTHYGTIPGCGDKKVLFKPGADLLAMTFRLVPKFAVTRTDLPNSHRECDVVCSMFAANGELLGQGVGSCSTLETKYRYRGGDGVDTGNAVPKAYWDLKKAGKSADAKQLIGGKGFSAHKTDDGDWHIFETTGERVENPDIADCYNTVLKMAKKRAHIDATLTVTGAADLFTQDLIDDDDSDNGDTSMEPIKEPTAKVPSTPPVKKDDPLPSDTGKQVKGILSDVEHIAYKKKDKKTGAESPAIRFALVVNGEKYGTFSETLADTAMALIDDEVILTFVAQGKFKNAESVAPVME